MKATYNEIGINYSSTRRTDNRIAEQIHSKLKRGKRILNIGAGTGSYEPENMELIAVEPSEEMISQRKQGSHKAVQAFAEELPFKDQSFTHAMTILSMHHWENKALAFKEIKRTVSDLFVAVTWNPNSEPFWLTRDYFPEIYKMDQGIFPSLDELSNHFENLEVSPLLIPEDCQDGFLAAFWKRPEAYLNAQVRQSISTFAKLEDYSLGLKQLKNDLENGTWEERNQDILHYKTLDAGYVIVTATLKSHK
ncbi:MAG: class I SAM-dependent methyltransferase [Aureisphaera sp.]